jgi:protein SCO1
MSETKKKFSMRKMALVVMVVGGIISIALQLANRSPSVNIPQELKGVVLPQPRPLTPFTLTDHNNKPFNLSRLQGNWTFLFFGYTHCPDICPTAMAELAEVFESLNQNSQTPLNTQGVFVSVDPERDRPETLKDYVPFFHPDFIGATGSAEQIKHFTKQLGAAYMISPEKDEQGDYLVSHASAFFLINPKGEFYAAFQGAMSNPEKISQSYLKIRSIN